MTTATPSWSFVTLVGDGDKTVATTDGAAGKALRKPGWLGWSRWVWILLILVVLGAIAAVVLVVVLGGATITLTKVESTLCTTAGGTTYAHLVHAEGSSSGESTAHAVYLHWNVTGSTCASSPKLEDTAWPLYKGRHISEGEGIPKEAFKIEEDYLMVKWQGAWCYTYQCTADEDAKAPSCATEVWPLVYIDGTALDKKDTKFGTCA
tara:strand:- start:11003 stop:11623 length:621 start_codon:yes stop_codon:yes gene_type:complete